MLEEALTFQRQIETPDRRFTGRILAELAGAYYALGKTKDTKYLEKGKPLVHELKGLAGLFSGSEKEFLNDIFAYYASESK